MTLLELELLPGGVYRKDIFSIRPDGSGQMRLVPDVSWRYLPRAVGSDAGPRIAKPRASVPS
jgi:hypothetical protein